MGGFTMKQWVALLVAGAAVGELGFYAGYSLAPILDLNQQALAWALELTACGALGWNWHDIAERIPFLRRSA